MCDLCRLGRALTMATLTLLTVANHHMDRNSVERRSSLGEDDSLAP